MHSLYCRSANDNFDIQRAIKIYHNELCRLQGKDGEKLESLGSTSSSAPCSPEVALSVSTSDISKRIDSNCDETDLVMESESLKDPNNDQLKSGPSLSNIPQNLQLVSPTKLLQSPTTPSSIEHSLSSCSTHPLKQIASITDSLQAKQPTNIPFPFGLSPGSYPIKPYKSILQPLNQTQIDRYESLNTDDLVRQVSFSFKIWYFHIVALSLYNPFDQINIYVIQ